MTLFYTFHVNFKLTNKESFEVHVRPVHGNIRLASLTHQQERDTDVLLRNVEPPEGLDQSELLGCELEWDLENR